jgi:hypothetical protein
VRIDTTQAEAVLRILSMRAEGEAVPADAWTRLFETAGYQRLKSREEGMGRAFTDAEFRAFVESEELPKKRSALEETLRAWSASDVEDLTKRALRYLPDDARIRATIYPLIKPRPNSFVFEVRSDDPAIMLYLDPDVPRAKFENTLVHELHHIGYGSACPRPEVAKEIEALPEGEQKVLQWIGAFGEGFAMLAAAGGASKHPHEASKAEDRERWDRTVANYENDRAAIEKFFQSLREGKLSEEEERKTAMSFYGEQGPWYTVGWKLAAEVEKRSGTDGLIATMCNPLAVVEALADIRTAFRPSL